MLSRSAPVEKKNMIFVGCDPGFSYPGVCVMDYDNKILGTYVIEGKGFQGDDFARAYQVATAIYEKFIQVVKNENLWEYSVVLGIEGSSYSKFSKSIDQMARVRQAIYDMFFLRGMVDFFVVVPIQKAKMIAGKGNATKDDVLNAVKEIYPDAIKNIEEHKVITKGKNKGENRITHEAETLADSISIAHATSHIWKG